MRGQLSCDQIGLLIYETAGASAAGRVLELHVASCSDTSLWKFQEGYVVHVCINAIELGIQV
jgi:hypothetical protein